MTPNNSMSKNPMPVACITGGAKRIGKAIVLALHDSGYQVIIHYHHSCLEAKQLTDLLNQRRANSAYCVQADLQHVETIAALAESIMEYFGRLDVLVHNASRFYPTKFGEILPHDWQYLMNSNAQAPLFLTQALLPYLQQSQGTVISILDIHANARPFKGYSVYNMAKSAHQMLVQSLALELAPLIRVNGIAPGVNILPEADSEQAIGDNLISDIRNSIPLQRIGTPDDIAQTVLFLAKSSYITGQVIAVDGGRSLTLAGSQ